MALSWLNPWRKSNGPVAEPKARRVRRQLRRNAFRPTLEVLDRRLLPSVSLQLVVAPSSAYNVTNSLVVHYTNTGTTAVPAPVLIVSADKANLWLPTDTAATGASLQVLATNPDPNGAAGTLAPGATGSIVVDFTSTTSTANTPINFSLGQLTPGQTIDWAANEASMQPSYIPAAAWNAVFTNFTANVGSTTDSYQAALDADATYLAQFGEPTNDVAGLIAFEIIKADNDFGTPALGGSVDVAVPTPGPDLSFGRTFQPTISGRNRMGLTSLGWASNWDIRASTDSQGAVSISAGGGLRFFTQQSDGSYLPTLSDSGILTALSGGGYQLTEVDGSITTFNANGTLNYVQDTNGNRITAAYNTGSQMISLTASDGDALILVYNTQGLVSHVTDSSGGSAGYTYDTAGHLLTVTTPQGTTNYTYVTGTTSGALNALQSIVNPDLTQINYTYDSQGRLTGSFFGTAANPIDPVTVGYLSPGGVSYTDAKGAKTTVLYTDLGQPAVVTDPLGRTSRLTYDPSGDLIGTALPGGATYSNKYDLQGNLLSQTDALGNTTAFTYDTRSNLTSYTDARANTTRYAYNGNNDLLSVTHADGTKQSYTYNALGEATHFLNARGQAVSTVYNTRGQVTKETFADGTSYSYGYDVHGNLTSATDAQNRVTLFVYGGDANNPTDPNLLTLVKYPDGTFLKFTYYAGGRRKQSVDQTGFTVNYSYDAVGRLTKLSDGSNNLVVQYTYDPATGNLIQTDNGNGTRTVYTYDLAGDLLSITNLAPDHATVNSFDRYTYDALGNVLTDTNQDGQWVYTYDADSQMTQAVFTPNSADPDRLTAQNLRYVYDAAGNRVSQTINGVTSTYAVNNVNEYTSSATAGATTTYQYDADGNLITQAAGGSTTTYTFNQTSQLIGVSGSGLTTSYFYDPLGNRVSQTVNGATTNFQIDPALGDVAAFGGTGAYNNSSGLLAHYTRGLGLTSQVSAAGAAGYYDFGLTGNTTGITNAAGSYVNKYSYLPFGQTTTLAAALPNPFTFVGQFGVMQDASNLFAMGAREYASGTGQFLSNDPLGLAGGDGNIRRYVANNPVNLVDPEGTQYSIGTLQTGEQPPTEKGTIVTRYANGSAHYYNKNTHDSGKVYPGQPPQPVWTGTDSNGNKIYGEMVRTGTDGAGGQPVPNTSQPAAATYEGDGNVSGVYGTGKVRTFGSPDGGYVFKDNTPATFNVKKDRAEASGEVFIPRQDSQPPVPTANKVFTTTQANPIEGTEDSLVVGFVDANRISSNTPSPTTFYASRSDPDFSLTTTDYLQANGSKYNIISDVTFPVSAYYDAITTIPAISFSQTFGPIPVEDAIIVLGAVIIPVGPNGQYHGKIATYTDSDPMGSSAKGYYRASVVNTGSGITATNIQVVGGNSGYVTADLVFAPNFLSGDAPVVKVQFHDLMTYQPIGTTGDLATDPVVVSGHTSSVSGKIVQTGDPPLAIIDTTDPTITSASQVTVSVGTPSSPNAPIPLITGTTVTQLPDGVTQIVVNGVVSAVQPGAGPVAAAPLTITLGSEPPLTAQVIVDETASAYTVNPEVVDAVVGQPLRDIEVATLGGPANASYAAVIDWGDGETSPGQITALGGGQFTISGSKPHPYVAPGSDTITVTVNGPGTIPAPPAQTTALVYVIPPNQKYVASVYQDVLGRPIDAGGLAYWSGQLDQGAPRSQLVSLIDHSAEYYTTIIIPAYQKFLARSPDAGGLAYWVSQMQHGLTDEQLEAGFIGSPEYYAHSGGTDKAWVDAMYLNLLGRGPDGGGESFWIQQLALGANRATVAYGFAASPEREGQRVTGDYQKYLRRLPDAGGLGYWVDQFAHHGQTNEDLITGFVASDEYFKEHTSG